MNYIQAWIAHLVVHRLWDWDLVSHGFEYSRGHKRLREVGRIKLECSENKYQCSDFFSGIISYVHSQENTVAIYLMSNIRI